MNSVNPLNRMGRAGYAGMERAPRQSKLKMQGIQYNLICITFLKSTYASIYINSFEKETIKSGYF